MPRAAGCGLRAAGCGLCDNLISNQRQWASMGPLHEERVAGEVGFEPTYTESKSAV